MLPSGHRFFDTGDGAVVLGESSMLISIVESESGVLDGVAADVGLSSAVIKVSRKQNSTQEAMNKHTPYAARNRIHVLKCL
jgi:hypothetical protein